MAERKKQQRKKEIVKNPQEKGTVRQKKRNQKDAQKSSEGTVKKRTPKLSQKRNQKRRPPQKKRGLKTEKNTKHKRKSAQKRAKTFLIEGMLTILFSSLLFFLIQALTFRLPQMEGYSMAVTLNDQDRVFVNKLGALERFKMVYFKEPKTKDYAIRRIIGMPGDDFYYKDDRLFINNEEIPERFLVEALKQAHQNSVLLTEDFTLKEATGATKVPQGKYFLMGDNRGYATDSRYYGFAEGKNVVGTVEMRLLPLHLMANFN